MRTTFDRLWYNTNLMQVMMDDKLNLFERLLNEGDSLHNRPVDVNEGNWMCIVILTRRYMHESIIFSFIHYYRHRR